MKLLCRRYIGVKTVFYLDDFMSLDIETSHNDEYTWISSIQVLFNDTYKLFRKPMEFISYLYDQIQEYNLYNKRRLMIIIHNASYDLSYLLGYIQLYLPDKDDSNIIKRDKNDIISYRQGGLEFRDTFALVNCSLEKWGKDLNVEHKKQVGMYDYSKVIYQDSDLNENESIYDYYDVLSLRECFLKQLQIHNDIIPTVPYTSTGYVRRDAERITQSDKNYRKRYFYENRLSLDELIMCHDAFSGGYTHNNRFYNNKIVRCLIGHRDFRSEYPSELRNYPFPTGKPRMIYDEADSLKSVHNYTAAEIIKLYPKYSSIIQMEVTYACLNDDKISMPFMQRSKMDILQEDFCLKDNGRILSFKGSAVITVDNLMLKILTEQYNMQFRFLKILTFKNSYLPEVLCDLIDTYFKAKSDLKRIAKECEKKYGEFDDRTIEANINLLLAKQKLNGIYGMMVQFPLSDEYEVDYDEYDFQQIRYLCEMSREEKEATLEKFYLNPKKVLAYQIGVFVTALARYELYEYIKVIGYENCLYCDTDSIFYIKTDVIEKKIEALNKKKEKLAEKNKAYIITDTGEKIYYDHFEKEQDIVAFKGLHSKCYAYVTDSGEFKATIAGVPARSIIGMNGDKPIYLTREEELSDITAEDRLKFPDLKVDSEKALNNLREGFTFYTNTGTTCQYDKYMLHKDIDIMIDGHIINTFGGALISKLQEKQIKNMDMIGIKTFKVDFM